MHKETQAMKDKEIMVKAEGKDKDQRLKAVEIQQRAESESNKGMTKLQDTAQKLTAEGQNVDRKLATDLAKSSKKEI